MCRIPTNAIMIPAINYSLPRPSLNEPPSDSVDNAIKTPSLNLFLNAHSLPKLCKQVQLSQYIILSHSVGIAFLCFLVSAPTNRTILL